MEKMGNRKKTGFWRANTNLPYMCWPSWAMNRGVEVMPAWPAVLREAIVTVFAGEGGL